MGTIDLAGNRATQQRTEIGITQVWVSFQPPRQCTLRTHIRWASFVSQLGQIPTRGRRPEGICLYGLARSVFLIVLITSIEIPQSESSYEKPSTSRYAQEVRCADGVSLTQEEHYSMGTCFEVFLIIHALLLLVLLYATKLGGGAGKRVPWGS